MRPGQVAALAGAAYVGLDVVVGLLAGSPPAPAAPAAEVAAYVDSHQVGLSAGLWLFGLATIPLLWWFGSLWAGMVRAEDGAPRLAAVSLAGLVLGGAMSFGSAVVLASLPLSGAGAEDLTLFYTVAAVFLSSAGFGLAAHLAATNVLAARSGMFAMWLVVVGMAAAVAFVVSAVLGALSNDAVSNTLSLVGFLLWLVWILGVSTRMWRAAEWSVPGPTPFSPQGLDSRLAS